MTWNDMKHFDKEGDGEVPYELFLRHIRTTLPDGRLALAHQVFDRIGKLEALYPFPCHLC